MQMNLKSALRIAHGRCARPEDTVARLEAALGAKHPYRYVEEKVAESLYWGALLVEELDFPPMGKGASPALCKASALAEGAEWLALRRRRALAGGVTARQDDVPDALRIEDLLSHVATVTPRALDKLKALEAARHWVDGCSLMSGRELKVPLEYVHFISGTNGVAAGNCLEEAIVQGVHEVFERRAAITAVKNRMVAPSFDIESIANSTLRNQIDFLRGQDTDLYVKDLSFGGALPCVGVYFVNHRVPPELQAHHLLKVASSFDREAALMSCLTEYVQVCQLGRRREAGPRDYEQLLCPAGGADNFLPLFWFGYIPYPEAGFLTEGPKIPFSAGTPCGDCLEDIERAKNICRLLDKDLVVVDLTEPGVDFPVVQVVIPGYSDILPFHPASSPVLFKGWTRDLAMGEYKAAGGPRACSASGLFPNW